MVTVIGRVILLQTVLALSTACSGASATQSTGMGAPMVGEDIPDCTYVVGQLLVKFREPIGDVEAAALIEGEGGRIVRRLHGRQLFLISYPTRWTIEEAIEKFAAMPMIEWVEPNFKRRPYSGLPMSTRPCY